MNIASRPKWLMLVIVLNISAAAHAQYANMLDSILHQPSEAQPKKKDNQLSYPQNNSPLGPTAQKLRSKSYERHCITDNTSKNRGLWIWYNETEYLYQNQLLYVYDDEDNVFKEVRLKLFGKHLKKTIKTLRMLERKSPYAKNIINSLQNSENRFVLSLKKTSHSYTLFPLPNNRLGVLNNNAYAFQIIEGEKLIVDYAPFDKIGSGAEIRWTPKHKKICLAHELGHAYDANFGLLDDRLMQAYGEIMPAREIRALFHENMIRKDLKKALRTHISYGNPLIANGVPYTYPLPVPARY